jgi:hypothetical protein
VQHDDPGVAMITRRTHAAVPTGAAPLLPLEKKR